MQDCNRFEVGGLEFGIFTNTECPKLMRDQGVNMNIGYILSCILIRLKNSPRGKGQGN